ncbi:hypothetical protein HB780_00360 (plasmid) [Rhizobium lusitanum]|uniref:hypothetical protein n=1 Tax=Rhizobium lusitanum TaxID=293958 RepID=UPI00160CCC88|nr:hypothetical protein HB780_00360 [Rhizobium lusitanum]
MKIETKLGAMLACNAIVRSLESERVMVSAIDPVALMQVIDNQELIVVAGQVRALLQEVIGSI